MSLLSSIYKIDKLINESLKETRSENRWKKRKKPLRFRKNPKLKTVAQYTLCVLTELILFCVMGVIFC